MFSRASSWLLTTNATGDETIRLARNVAIISGCLMVMALLFVPVSFLQETPGSSLAAIAVGAIASLIAFITARAGRPLAGSTVLIAAITLAICSTLLSATPQSNVPFYLAIAVGVAGATLRSRQIWWALAGILAVLWGALLLPPRTYLAAMQGLNNAIGSSLFLIMMTVLSYLSAASAERALRAAGKASAAMRQAQAELEQANRSLEARVEERTAALSATLEQQRAQAEELAQSLAAQQRLSKMILDLSLPIIPISDHVLIVPLIGNIDTLRASQLLDSVLGEFERRRARVLVLDVTGVAIVDTAVAQALLRVADATRLLGGTTVLVGIRPEVAQTLVGLGVDFRNLRTAASLQEGLRLAA